jgi:NAD(P)-dependent dehydrogenase (short-subunit alcohol dehydrogenase family)
MRLRNRVAIVTGAGSGIGAAIATGIADEGGTVVGLDLEASDGAITILACDVADAVSVNRAVAAVIERHGRVDIVVNAAGIWRPGNAVDASIEDWDATMAVNVRGPYLVSRAAIPSMNARGGGAIVHVASISGIVGDTDNVAYVASKGAVISLTRAMALDHAAEAIRVNCICPGMTRTPMLDATEEALSPADAAALNERRINSIPLGRLGSTDDIRDGVLYLVSDDAAWVTGTCLTVDGGTTAGRSVRNRAQGVTAR